MGDADTTQQQLPPKHPTPMTVQDADDEEEASKKQKLNNGSTPPAAITSSEDITDVPAKNNNAAAAEPDQQVEIKKEQEPTFPVQVIYNKNPIPLQISPSMTVLELKKMIEAHTGVDPNLQKVLLKGIAKDESLLKDLGVSEGTTKKILVIGSSIQDVLKVKEVPSSSALAADDAAAKEAAGSNWCSLPSHKKVVDKGVPDDVMPGILNEHDPLPPFPLHGMYSNKGSKVRLTFKLENDELWIGTKERTEKVPISTIRNVTSQPITGYEHYHILAIQLGTTEASRFFVYWVPAQYVEAIKDALTGA